MSNLPAPLPASNPCGSCPYRRDAPQGLWQPEEYDKLPAFDRQTWEQPSTVFLCHQENGRICSGWAGCHDMEHNLGARLAVLTGDLTGEEHEALLAYTTNVELFDSGSQAAEHGLAGSPTPETVRLRYRLDAKLARARTDGQV